MAEFINVTRYDIDGKPIQLGWNRVKEQHHRYRSSPRYIAPAKIIAADMLALYKHHEPTNEYDESRYHVIHIPTGLVIAEIPYNLVADVKSSFMASQWTLRGDNTLVMIPKPPNKYQKLYNHKPMEQELTCLIRYTLERIDNDTATQ